MQNIFTVAKLVAIAIIVGGGLYYLGLGMILLTNTAKLLLFHGSGITIVQDTLKILKSGSKDQRLHLAK